jgi:hypothetical protein
MIIILSALVSVLSFRFRGRASLELELIALRHQVTVLRRQRPSRPKLFRADRLLWVWLYRFWPRALHIMVLVKPATVIQWHRKGFQLYWRCDQDTAIRDGCAFSIGAGRCQALSDFSIEPVLMSVAGSALLFGIGTEALP